MIALALLFDTSPAHVSLMDLAMVLCVAAVTTVLFQRFKQPVVLGCLLAGIIVGPFTPGATVHDLDTIHELSELGMILVLFSIGLEFSIQRLVGFGPRSLFVAAFHAGAMMWLGFLAGRTLGLDWRSSLFGGGIVSISSTVLIQRVFAECQIERRNQETVMGVLVYEDVVGLLLIAGLSTIAVSGDIEFAVIATAGGKLALFLASSPVIGVLVVPRATPQAACCRKAPCANRPRSCVARTLALTPVGTLPSSIPTRSGPGAARVGIEPGTDQHPVERNARALPRASGRFSCSQPDG